MFGIKIYAIYRKRWSFGCSGVTAIRSCGSGFGIPECFGRKNGHFTYDLIESSSQRCFRTSFTRQHNEVIAGETVGFKLSGQRFIVVIESCYVHTGSYKCIVHAFGRLGSTAEISHFGRFGRSIGTFDNEVVESNALTSVERYMEFDGNDFTHSRCDTRNIIRPSRILFINNIFRTIRQTFFLQFYRCARCCFYINRCFATTRTETSSIYRQFCRSESNSTFRS